MCSAADGTCVPRAMLMAAPISSEISATASSVDGSTTELRVRVLGMTHSLPTNMRSRWPALLRCWMIEKFIESAFRKRRQGCSLPSIRAWPRMLGNAVGCVMIGAEDGPLDVQKLKLRVPRAGAVMRVLHKAGCRCASRYSRSCRRAYVRGLHIGRTRPVAAAPSSKAKTPISTSPSI